MIVSGQWDFKMENKKYYLDDVEVSEEDYEDEVMEAKNE